MGFLTNRVKRDFFFSLDLFFFCIGGKNHIDSFQCYTCHVCWRHLKKSMFFPLIKKTRIAQKLILPSHFCQPLVVVIPLSRRAFSILLTLFSFPIASRCSLALVAFTICLSPIVIYFHCKFLLSAYLFHKTFEAEYRVSLNISFSTFKANKKLKEWISKTKCFSLKQLVMSIWVPHRCKLTYTNVL